MVADFFPVYTKLVSIVEIFAYGFGIIIFINSLFDLNRIHEGKSNMSYGAVLKSMALCILTIASVFSFNMLVYNTYGNDSAFLLSNDPLDTTYLQSIHGSKAEQIKQVLQNLKYLFKLFGFGLFVNTFIYARQCYSANQKPKRFFTRIFATAVLANTDKVATALFTIFKEFFLF